MMYSLDDVSPQTPKDGDFWIAPNASVIGDVVIGSASAVWFNAAIRGDNEQIVVGNGSNVQENCVLHTDMGFPLTIGTNCTIGHSAILHGCTIGDNSLIGMGATVLNGAVVGKNCLIGAGALVTEGKQIPDGSLVVGAPAKVVRDLTEDQIANLTNSALTYQSVMRRFRKGLAPIPQSSSE